MISKILQILSLQLRISIFFSRSLEQFFLTVGQNNFGNKIPFFSYNFQDGSWKFGLKDLGLSQSRVSKMNTFPLIGAQESEINLMEEEEEDNIPGNFLNKTENPFRLKGY